MAALPPAVSVPQALASSAKERTASIHFIGRLFQQLLEELCIQHPLRRHMHSYFSTFTVVGPDPLQSRSRALKPTMPAQYLSVFCFNARTPTQASQRSQVSWENQNSWLSSRERYSLLLLKAGMHAHTLLCRACYSSAESRARIKRSATKQ